MTLSQPRLRDLIEASSEGAGRLFRENGYVRPLWHAIKSDGVPLIVRSPPGDKDFAVTMVRALFEIEEVIRYVFFDEAWMVVEKRADNIPDIETKGIVDHPNRVECIYFNGEDLQEGWLCARRLIVRDRAGKGRLQSLEFYADFDNATGRLLGLLPRGTKQ